MGEKVVLDTSVVVSGLIGRGASNKILGLVVAGRLRIVLSSEIFSEYVRAVNYPKIKVPLLYVYAILNRLYGFAEKVSPKKKVSLCRDPSDDVFVEVAYESKAKCIVTLDKDLLDLRNREKKITVNDHEIKILMPKEFLKEERIE